MMNILDVIFFFFFLRKRERETESFGRGMICPSVGKGRLTSLGAPGNFYDIDQFYVMFRIDKTEQMS